MGFGSGGFDNLRGARKCESVKPCKGAEQEYPVTVKVYSNGSIVQVNASKTCNQFCARSAQDMVTAVMNEFPYQHIRYDWQQVNIAATTGSNFFTISENGVAEYIRTNLNRHNVMRLRIHARYTEMDKHSSAIFREWWETDENGGSFINFIIETGYKNQFSGEN